MGIRVWLSACLLLGIISSHYSLPTTSAGKKVLDTRKYIDVLDDDVSIRISYLDTEVNSDTAVIFLHGSPLYSYVYRDVIPHVQDKARCLAPDMAGMGFSAKLDDPTKYTFVDQYRYFKAWIAAMDLPEKIVFVAHDWGSAMACKYASENTDSQSPKVAGVVIMEPLIAPVPTWEDFGFEDTMIALMKLLRTPLGEELTLHQPDPVVVEIGVPNGIIRNVTEEELDAYKLPFREPGEGRRPTLTWPRQLPVVEDGPADVVAIFEELRDWLAQSSDLPKLFISADPGFLSPWANKVSENWPNLRKQIVTALHFVPEDVPHAIGESVSEFITEIGYVTEISKE